MENCFSCAYVEHIEVLDVCKTYIVVIAAGCQFINDDDNNSIYITSV